MVSLLLFFFKQKTAYEMRISDWSSDVCSSDLRGVPYARPIRVAHRQPVARPRAAYQGLLVDPQPVVQPVGEGQGGADMLGEGGGVERRGDHQHLGRGRGALEDRKSTRLNSSH